MIKILMITLSVLLAIIVIPMGLFFYSYFILCFYREIRDYIKGKIKKYRDKK